MSSTHDDESLKVQARGRIEFTDDDADVKQLSPGGYLIIEKTTGSVLSRERARFEAREQNGTIARKYSVNGKTLSDEEGRTWLKTFLPDLVRETGFNADRRVARFLAHGGPAAVLADVSQIRSDHAKSVYIRELFKQTTLDAAILDKALRQAGREIRSDYDLAQVLTFASESQPIDGAMPAFVDASRSIDSDYDARNVYTRALGRPSMTAALASQIFTAATPGAGKAGISSDYDLAEVLIATPATLIAQDASGWFGAINSIQSSYDRRRVISKVVEPGVSPDVTEQALKAAAGIQSDYDLAEVLVDIVKDGGLTDSTAPAFFAALPHVGSDYEHRKVLQAVAQATVSDGALAQATATTSGMSSDYDRAESLVAISHSKALGPSTRKALADAANGISGDHDRGRVLSALTRAGVLTAR
jgi:bla regulator protein blaR1